MHDRRHARMVSSKRYWLISVLLALVVALPAGATEKAEPASEDDWKFDAVLWPWFMSLDGDVTVKGNTADVDMSFSDIWDNLNIALMARLEASKGRWGFSINPIYGEMESETGTTILNQPTSIDVTIKMFMMAFAVNYRFGPFPLGHHDEGTTPTITILPQLGANYTYLDADVEIRSFKDRSGSESQDWVDPFLGTRTILDLTPRWHIVLSGNVGGFGAGSDVTWAAHALGGYRVDLSERLEGRILVGYRALYQDYEDGSGSDRFAWDTTMHGPVLVIGASY